MNAPNMARLIAPLALIQAAGVPALRVAFTLAFAGFLGIGRYIYRRRHLFFDRDPEVNNDFAVVRHIRMENIIFVWGALTMVLFCICIAVWSA